MLRIPYADLDLLFALLDTDCTGSVNTDARQPKWQANNLSDLTGCCGSEVIQVTLIPTEVK